MLRAGFTPVQASADRMLQTVHVLRGTLSVLIAAGAFLIVSGLQLRYYVRTGPGPGFFPVWIGALLAASSLYLLVETFRSRDGREPFFPTGEAAKRLGLIVMLLLAAWVALEYLGYRLAILGFALVAPRLFGKQSTVTTIVVALIASFGVAYVFEKWLGVWLPTPQIEFLQRLGL
jgi:putative tricarboxylic transport membrane protein